MTNIICVWLEVIHWMYFSHWKEPKLRTFKTQALTGYQVFKSSTLQQKHQKEMPPPNKSILFIQLPNTVGLYSAAVLPDCTWAWLNHIDWAPWGFQMKNATQIHYLHSFTWHKCVWCFLRVSSEIQLNISLFKCNTYMRIWWFTPSCDKH